MLEVKIAPSILAGDFANLGKVVADLEAAGADLIHCDVMDGQFVNRITFGSQMVAALRKHTSLPLDVHLMAEHPQTHIVNFALAGADTITVHYEACKKMSYTYLAETLHMIREYGKRCGVVISPRTPVSAIYDVLHLCDMVLLMSVNPGYGGQKFLPVTLNKLRELRAYADSIGRADLDIEVDGGVTEENIGEIVKAGANVLVAGSTVFKADDLSAVIANLKRNATV